MLESRAFPDGQEPSARQAAMRKAIVAPGSLFDSVRRTKWRAMPLTVL